MMFGVEDNLHKTRPWKDPRVRIAIRKSINFKAIGELLSAKQKLEAAGIPIEVLTETHVNRHPGYWLNPEKGELGDLSQNYLYDVAEAKKLISAAGVPVPFDMNFYVEAIQGTVPQNNTLVVDSLKQAGTVNLTPVVSNNAREFRDRRAFLLADGLVAETTNQNEIDQILYREYHTLGNEGRSDQPFPTPELDALILKQRAALNVEDRWSTLKELQRKLAAHFPLIPGQDDFTTLSFRWPWLHNIGYGATGELLPAGRVPQGGHLQWLDKNMPNRDKLG
jgi:ABC-type transport system substrate-binding protein